MPDTCASRWYEAVFTLTPTWFTHESTTASRLFLQAGLRDVVLVLADADALGIDLHQLGQRILQPARDRDGAADGDVQVGELLARDVAGAVDAGARLADHHHRHVELEVAQRLAHEGLGLAPGGAVADGDGADAALLHQVGQDRRGGGLAARASPGA